MHSEPTTPVALTRIAWKPSLLIAVGFVMYHLYTTYFGLLPGMQHNVVHLGFLLTLALVLDLEKPVSIGRRIFTGAVLVGGLSSSVVAFLIDDRFTTKLDAFFALLMMITLLEVIRRSLGLVLASLIGLVLIYPFLGPYLPGLLNHGGYSIERVAGMVYMSTSGIYGSTLGVSATTVILFIVFSSLLEATEATRVFNDLALRLFGRFAGGPAKVAVVASALMGSLSGSAVANVATTGVVTIPLMKKVGYSPQFAAAVEAASSTGGQFTPPILSAVAFLMADILQVNYMTVVYYSMIPAFLYYTAIFLAVHLRGRRLGLRGLTSDQIEELGVLPARIILLRYGHLFLPFALLIYLMSVVSLSPMRSAMWAIVALLVLTTLRKETRLNLTKLLASFLSAGKSMIVIGGACAGVGVINGILDLTGLGLRASSLLVRVSGDNLLLLLVLAAIVSIIIGMGTPAVPSYLLLAIYIPPALEGFGVPLAATHFFLFYLACLSSITPPVAVAAFTASGIAGSEPNATGLTAWRLGMVGFVISFLFIYRPSLLGIGTPTAILYSVAAGLIFTFFLTVAWEGYLTSEVLWYERLAFGAGALALVVPGLAYDIAAALLLAGGLLAYGLRTATRQVQGTPL